MKNRGGKVRIIQLMAAIAIICFPSKLNACDDSYASITNIVDQGGGITRYFFELCPEYNGLEGSPEAFGFQFTPASVTVVGFSPAAVTTSSGDIYTGGILSPNIYWTTGSLFPGHGSANLCFTGYIDVTGTPTEITAVTHEGYPDVLCLPLVYSSTPPISDLGCGDTFYDSGGSSGDYSSNENFGSSNWLICADNIGDSVTVTFNTIDVEGSTFDYLNVYNGQDNNAQLLDDFINDSDVGNSYTSTNIYGCLYFEFKSDGSVEYDGWEATITCTMPTSCQASPTLSWD